MPNRIHVNVSVRSLALMSIFNDLHADSARILAWNELVALWQQTGLRDSDLDLGLRELSAAGQLRISGHEQERRIALTDQGAGDSSQIHEQVRSTRSGLAALTVLLQTSRRGRSQRPGYGRRQQDTATVQQLVAH